MLKEYSTITQPASSKYATPFAHFVDVALDSGRLKYDALCVEHFSDRFMVLIGRRLLEGDHMGYTRITTFETASEAADTFNSLRWIQAGDTDIYKEIDAWAVILDVGYLNQSKHGPYQTKQEAIDAADRLHEARGEWADVWINGTTLLTNS